MRTSFLRFSRPSIDEEEIAEVVDTLRSGWITTGPKVRRLETEFARALEAPGALALSSGTGALHVALTAFAIGHGDHVITTPMTFCSTVHVIEHVGARPLLVDIDPETLNIDPELVTAALERSHTRERQGSRDGAVRAMIPVHYAGHPCDMDSLTAIADEYGLDVIEDAAHAVGARYKNRPVGHIGRDRRRTAVCFSLYATKNVTTAEGGILIAPPEVLEEARVWSVHGMTRDAHTRYEEGSWFYDVVRAGFKYNMTDIQAAIGLHQLRKLPAFGQRRRQIADAYGRAFKELEEVEVPIERRGVEHAWHLYALRLNLERLRITRDDFIKELKMRNIGSSVHFIPIHLHPYYRAKYGYRADDFPVALREYERVVSLPLYPRMTDDDVADVIDAVTAIVHRYRR